jgi:hypothetical protein
MALCSSRRLVRGMGSVLGQHWWYRVMSCPDLARHLSWQHVVIIAYFFPLLKTITITVCNLFSRSETSYFIWKLLEYNSLRCKNVMVIVSLDSPSCEVTLLILCSVVYRDVIRQAKGLYRLKHVGALRNGLTYLSRYNSGGVAMCGPHVHQIKKLGKISWLGGRGLAHLIKERTGQGILPNYPRGPHTLTQWLTQL